MDVIDIEKCFSYFSYILQKYEAWSTRPKRPLFIFVCIYYCLYKYEISTAITASGRETWMAPAPLQPSLSQTAQDLICLLGSAGDCFRFSRRRQDSLRLEGLASKQVRTVAPFSRKKYLFWLLFINYPLFCCHHDRKSLEILISSDQLRTIY